MSVWRERNGYLPVILLIARHLPAWWAMLTSSRVAFTRRWSWYERFQRCWLRTSLNMHMQTAWRRPIRNQTIKRHSYVSISTTRPMRTSFRRRIRGREWLKSIRRRSPDQLTDYSAARWRGVLYWNCTRYSAIFGMCLRWMTEWMSSCVSSIRDITVTLSLFSYLFPNILLVYIRVITSSGVAAAVVVRCLAAGTDFFRRKRAFSFAGILPNEPDFCNLRTCVAFTELWAASAGR